VPSAHVHPGRIRQLNQARRKRGLRADDAHDFVGRDFFILQGFAHPLRDVGKAGQVDFALG
jgi:hypothetical protein